MKYLLIFNVRDEFNSFSYYTHTCITWVGTVYALWTAKLLNSFRFTIKQIGNLGDLKSKMTLKWYFNQSNGVIQSKLNRNEIEISVTYLWLYINARKSINFHVAKFWVIIEIMIFFHNNFKDYIK